MTPLSMLGRGVQPILRTWKYSRFIVDGSGSGFTNPTTVSLRKPRILPLLSTPLRTQRSIILITFRGEQLERFQLEKKALHHPVRNHPHLFHQLQMMTAWSSILISKSKTGSWSKRTVPTVANQCPKLIIVSITEKTGLFQGHKFFL